MTVSDLISSKTLPICLSYFFSAIEPPSIVQAKVIDKINVDLVWSHPNDISDIPLDYQIIYFGYKRDEIQKVD